MPEASEPRLDAAPHRTAACLAFLLLSACSAEPELHHSHTNVLWITICTLRADHLGAWGYPVDVSPNLDRLAERAALFEQTLTAAPWTRPSVASMITGLYPRSLGFMEPGPAGERALHFSFETLAERFQQAGYYTIGITANPNTNATWHFDQGYDFYRGTARRWGDPGFSKVSAEEVAALLLDQLRGRARGRRFLAHLVLVDVHPPQQSEVARRRVGDFQAGTGTFSEYDLQIVYVDAVIGDLLEELGRMGLEDTLLVLNSDHGEGFEEAGPDDLFHGGHLHDSTLWVPLILHHPSLEGRAARFADRVESVDVAPTLMELLGMEFSADEFEGRSLAPAILGSGPVPVRDFSVAETRLDTAEQSTLLRKSWKLVVDERASPATTSLYHYRDGELQLEDLSEERRTLTRRLVMKLRLWQVERRGRLPEAAAWGSPSLTETEALRALGYLPEK